MTYDERNTCLIAWNFMYVCYGFITPGLMPDHLIYMRNKEILEAIKGDG